MRTVEIRFEKSAYEEYLNLKTKAQNKNSIEARIFGAVERVLDDLKTSLARNAPVRIGNAISVSKLSSKLAKSLKKENVNIIWSVELPEAWRLVYYISGEEIRVIAFVLNLSDHKKYAKFLNQ